MGEILRALARYEIARTMVDGERAYATPDGNMYSVTTILSNTGDQRALMEWREGIGEERAKDIVEAACWRGEQHHLNIEKWLEDGIEPEPNFITSTYWKSIRPFLGCITKPLLIEGAVWHPENYAGTLDCIAYTTEFGDQPVLLDWKTADKPRNKQKVYTYSLQLAAYREAVNYVYANTGLRVDYAQLAIALPNRNPQIETFDGEALDQLFRHFIGRKNRFLSRK